MTITTRLRVWLLRRRIARAQAAAEYSRQALGDAHGALLHHRRVEIEARAELDRLTPRYAGHVPPRPMPQPGLGDAGKVPTPRPWPPAPAKKA